MFVLKNTVEQLVRAIADLIIVGDLKPDDKLDEGSLATRFEVSRTPVREALRQLCAMGLVERKPNKSAVVTNVTGGFLTSMFEAMAELEGMCARLAAERMTLEERRGWSGCIAIQSVLCRRGRRRIIPPIISSFTTGSIRAPITSIFWNW